MGSGSVEPSDGSLVGVVARFHEFVVILGPGGFYKFFVGGGEVWGEGAANHGEVLEQGEGVASRLLAFPGEPVQHSELEGVHGGERLVELFDVVGLDEGCACRVPVAVFTFPEPGENASAPGHARVTQVAWRGYFGAETVR